MNPPRSSVSRIGRAYLLLIAVDLLVRFRGFPALAQRVRASPVSQVDVPRERERIERDRRAVDEAARLYFKRAWCLQRSAVLVLLLRRAGIPARLVLGVQPFPFAAHAWAEVEGTVVNDRPETVATYEVLEQL